MVGHTSLSRVPPLGLVLAAAQPQAPFLLSGFRARVLWTMCNSHVHVHVSSVTWPTGTPKSSPGPVSAT